MAFPVGARTTGELITASIWNADLKDNLNTLRGGGIALTTQGDGDIIKGSSSTTFGRVANPGDATKFLNGALPPAFAFVKESDLAFTDVTTNDASTTKHGFLKKLPNDAALFLNGLGAFAALTGGMDRIGYSTATYTSTGATNMVPVTISGLTAKDGLFVFGQAGSHAGNTITGLKLYNSTNSVNLCTFNAGAINPISFFGVLFRILETGGGGGTYVTASILTAVENQTGPGVDKYANSAFTWTDTWDMAIRYESIGSGTIDASLSVFKLKGQ